MGELSGRVALVTGGARGLGAAAAKALAAKGAKVVVSDVRDGTETAAAIDGAFVKHDVTSEEEWIAAVQFAKDKFGGLDILVNNAGVFWMMPLPMETLENFRKMQAINVEGVFLGLKHCIPAIAERAHLWDGGGAVVNLSSVAGIVGAPNIIAYNASKGAVRLMTKSAALEYAAHKVRVNSVHPGIIDTPMMAEAAKVIEATTGQGANATRDQFATRHPLGRMGRDIDIANAVAFLASDAAAFITGSELVVDGGMTAI
ncbi:glucose 1-dehydrogenase [Vitreimonas sp.]|uniref:SDR family NAD(P)-dependent oxidoreductase n=1 Tax=Vitreimonas sp. TaxID=3069702 RepID=UPI002ED97354